MTKTQKREREKKWEKFFNKSENKLRNLNERFKRGSFLSIDLEEFEFSKKILLEIGISIYENKTIKTYHFIVKENYKKRNGRYVEDNKDNFNFGESEILNITEIKKRIKDISKDIDYLVGHSLHNDITFLNKIGVKHFKEHFDTQEYYKRIYETRQEISLGNLCNLLEIETENLHNGANDAHYTMLCLIKLNENKENKS